MSKINKIFSSLGNIKNNNINNINNKGLLILALFILVALSINYLKITKYISPSTYLERQNNQSIEPFQSEVKNAAGMDSFIDRRAIRIGSKEGEDNQLLQIMNVAPRKDDINFTITLEIMPNIHSKSDKSNQKLMSKQLFSGAIIDGDTSKSNLYRRDFFGEPIFNEMIIKEIDSTQGNDIYKEYNVYLRKNFSSEIKNIQAYITLDNIDPIRDTVYGENNSPTIDDSIIVDSDLKSTEVLRTSTGKKIYDELKTNFSKNIGNIEKNAEKLNKIESDLKLLPEKINVNTSKLNQLTPEKLSTQFATLENLESNTSKITRNRGDILLLEQKLSNLEMKIQEKMNSSKTQSTQLIREMKQELGKNLSSTVNKSLDSFKGLIVMWSGSVLNIPSGWVLCDGKNGTPDLRNRFILGKDSDSQSKQGGSNKITVDNLPPHNHSFNLKTNNAGNHNHSISMGPWNTGGSNCVGNNGSCHNYGFSSGGTSTSGNHSHTVTGNINNQGKGTDYLPKYYRLAFIMKE